MAKLILTHLPLLILCHLTTFTFTSASVIVFSGTPESISPPFSPNLTLRCSLQDIVLPTSADPIIGKRSIVQTNDNIKFVTSIEILKGSGKTHDKVASVTTYFDATPLGNWTDVTATGDLSVDQPGERGFLQLVWVEPTDSVSGTFTCAIHALDDTGSSVHLSTELDIDVHVPSLPDLVNVITDLNNIVNSLASQNQGLNNTVNTLTTSMNTLTSQNQGLDNTVNTLTTSMNTLTSQNQGLNNTVNTLTSSMNTLTSQNQGLNNTVNTLTTSMDTLTSQNQGLTTDLTNMKSELDETRHVESGVVICGWSRGWTGPNYSTTKTTSFSRPYTRAPVVFLSYRNIDFDTPTSGDRIDIVMGLNHVNTADFTVYCRNIRNHDMNLYLNWLAIPQ